MIHLVFWVILKELGSKIFVLALQLLGFELFHAQLPLQFLSFCEVVFGWLLSNYPHSFSGALLYWYFAHLLRGRDFDILLRTWSNPILYLVILPTNCFTDSIRGLILIELSLPFFGRPFLYTWRQASILAVFGTILHHAISDFFVVLFHFGVLALEGIDLLPKWGFGIDCGLHFFYIHRAVDINPNALSDHPLNSILDILLRPPCESFFIGG